MMSPDFLRRLQEMRQARLRTQDFQKWKDRNPTAATGAGVWTAAPWTGQTAQTIVYDPTNGKAYPNPAAALSAGVTNFTYQIPPGMNIDWSYWDQFRQPVAPRPAAAPAQTVTVADQTIPFRPPAKTEETEETEETDTTKPFEIPELAKRFADAGMFGRAKKAVEDAGGTWTKEMSRKLRAAAKATKYYGGVFENQSTIDALVDKYTLANASSGPGGKISYKVMMGKAKRDYEKKHGVGSWTKAVHVAVAASLQRKLNADAADSTRDISDNTNVIDSGSSGSSNSGSSNSGSSNSGSSNSDIFGGIKRGRLAEAQRYADAGMFGRAKQQIELGGGTWNKDISRKLRADAKSTTNYGGDYKDQAELDALLQNSKVLVDGKLKMGRAKQAYEKKHGKGSWSKTIHKRLKASHQRNQ